MGTNHFKTQQEIWKYVADGGAVENTSSGTVVKFINGRLNYIMDLFECENWSPYIEPVAKKKVWRWENVTKDKDGRVYIDQSVNLMTEEYAAEYLENYTKVPNSEREI